MNELAGFFSIGAVERDTGIGRDTLRVWERRYGFPSPARNDKGERVYPETQLRMLQRIRRLMDQGVRPGQVLPPNETNLSQLEASLMAPEDAAASSVTEVILDALSGSNTDRIKKLLQTTYEEQGMEAFVQETVAPMLVKLGNRWFTGELRIFHEHILSQYLIRFLNSKILEHKFTDKNTRVVLATLPGEQHSLGLLMVASLLAVQGIEAINLGSEAPIDEIDQAVRQSGAKILGLTFSTAYPYSSIRSNLVELRSLLPQDIEIWVGGEGVRRLRKLPVGVTKFTSLDEVKNRIKAIAANIAQKSRSRSTRQ
jgi:DNA-binding transcriptional MerR regulator/methylmalonyl-CoA mutase cobalamin-binding subunit